MSRASRSWPRPGAPRSVSRPSRSAATSASSSPSAPPATTRSRATRWGADYPHANNQLGLFVCGGGNNDVQYCNPDFDALITQAAGEPDQDKQVALYNQAQKILMDDAAFLPLRFAVSTFEVQPYVGGITATPSDSQLPGDLFYETMYIKTH